MEGIHLTQDRNELWNVMNTLMNLQSTQNVKIFVSSWANISLSRTAPWRYMKTYLNFSFFLIFMCISPPAIAFYINKNNLNSTVKSQSCWPDARCQIPSPLCNCSTNPTQTSKLINCHFHFCCCDNTLDRTCKKNNCRITSHFIIFPQKSLADALLALSRGPDLIHSFVCKFIQWKSMKCFQSFQIKC